MTIEWTRVRALYQRAFELPTGDQRTFLEAACGDDKELLREVLSLLESSANDDGFLEPPSLRAIEALVAPAQPLGSGATVGTFRIERLIASGGMGVVYEAHQESPRRKVALKVMRLGLVGENSVRRFQLEAEILAGLRHPAIAAIYETGVHTVEGREVPWFAMEFIEDARSIVRFAEEERLTIHQMLCLFEEVCAAIHHGHMKGIIHRDLKPDNLLVGGDGRPRVIDFGVARATDADFAITTMQTEAGAIVGTLATMSPEQIAGDRKNLDFRCDVYSLGVVLYRMLTGVMPHNLSELSLPEAARTIREASPPRPGTIETRLRGDLETILLKALEKEPSRRYSSAEALREDLERFRLGEPIHARPPSFSYQLRLMARRHRAVSFAALSIAVITLFALAISLRFGVRASRSAEESARRFAIVRAVGRDLLFDVLAEMRNLGGGTQARAKVAETALQYLSALESEANEDPELLVDLVRGYRQLGSFQGDPDASSLGMASQAEASYEHALALASKVTQSNVVDDAWRRDLLALKLDLASLKLRLGHVAEGERLIDDVLQESEYEGDGLIAAAAHVILGDQATSAGDDSLALDHFTQARRLYESLGEAYPEKIALVEGRLGTLALRAQQYAEADSHLSAADSTENSSVLDEIDALGDRAILEERRDDVEKSLAIAQEMIALARDLVAADINDAVARGKLAWSLDIQGAAQGRLGDFEAALESFGESAELYEANGALAPDDLETQSLAAEIHAKEAGTLLSLDRIDECLEIAASSVEDLEEILRRDPDALGREFSLSVALDVWVRALMIDGDFDRAPKVLERFREVAQRQADRDLNNALAQRQMLLVHDRIGTMHEALGKDESLPLQDRIAAYRRAAQAYDDCLKTFGVLDERGFLYPGDEQAAPGVEQALAACEEALEVLAREGADG